MNHFYGLFFSFAFGALAYPLVEILWRGYTHFSMSIAGGLCFAILFEINHSLSGTSIWVKCLLGALAITSVEFITGWIVNLRLHLNVWDYSHLPFNLLGQICLPFTAIWYLLSYPVFKISEGVERIFMKS